MTKRNNEAAETFAPGTRVLCPVCGKSVKVKANGTLARHGHRNALGTGGGHCVATSHDFAGAIAAGIEANETFLAHGLDCYRGPARSRMERRAKDAIARLSSKLPAPAPFTPDADGSMRFDANGVRVPRG